MDGTWVHTLEDGIEPISLSNRPPAPAPKPQRFQSVRVTSGRPKFQERAPPRRNSAFYGGSEIRHLDNRLHEGAPQTGGFGDLSLVDPHNRLQKLEQMLSKRQYEEEAVAPDVIPGVIYETLEFSEDTMLQTKPAVRDCNWEQFKNHYPDEMDTFAIEVLLTQDDLADQIEADQLRRLKPEQRKAFEPTRRKPRQPRGRKRVGSTPIERVRINSAIILGYLSKVTGEGPWVEKPHTFLAPFNLFIHFQEKMEEELRALEAVFGDDATSLQPANNTDTGTSQFEFLSNQELQGMMRSRRAYADMKCYVDFVKARLIPRRNMFSDADNTRPSKVSYRDLAALFRVGDLVIEPGTSQAESSIKDKRSSVVNVTESKLWRVCYISEDTPNWSVHNLDAPGSELQSRIDVGDEATHLRLYYIDFNGKQFSPVRGDASIEFFEGEKEITKLPVYPLKFHKEHPNFLSGLQERGQRFKDIVSSGNPTLSYHGWTLTKDPAGRDLTSKPEQGTVWPEYIESDVIVDFTEAFQVNPWWKPAFQQFPEAESFYPTATRDEFPIVEWSDRSRFKQFGTREEIVIEYDGVRELEWEKFLETDPFINHDEEPEPFGHLAQTLTEDDLALLPSRLFVYALRSRSFINADIKYMKPVRDTLNPLESLQLPEKHKVMIQSAVFGHLEKKKVRRRATLLNSEFLDQDIIHGKGRGLAVLLHGPPGVGKTATAEAVAHFYKKPLFPITSSDLGTDPWDVETKLTEIFRLANLWDCILLLDEAETLLAQREKKDNNLQKSSLVSVFLRTLEYYSGILFLTTNRPDVMDDAVKSRVQVSLQYPRLGLIETLAIFQTNLDRLIDIEFERSKITGEAALDVNTDGILAFAAAHYHRHEGNMASPPWNGRQIRNAFQIAPSIARYGRGHISTNNITGSSTPSTGTQSGSDQEPCIGPEHFEKVEESTAESETNRQPTSAGGADGRLSPSLVPHSSPNRQTTFQRRGIRTNRFSSEIQRNRFSGEFHLRQRSSSSVAPLYLPSTQPQAQQQQQYEDRPTPSSLPHLREPSPPWTPDLASVSDDASPR
ncbi:putative AAA family protein [Rosellinia necatrix]|uniref:Putative AAA family protein n=1 Tax=Rosellinia necatrix TaxID=77044 RepID=A0A1W2TNT5_ROSNE|nr:putative AAA family protein [Rosellinia necatrix]